MSRLVFISLIAAFAAALLAGSKKRNPLLWSFLCFFFPVLIIVLIFLPPLASSRGSAQCQNCSRVIRADDRICRFCGREQPIPLVLCDECGSFVPGAETCSHCGKKLKK